MDRPGPDADLLDQVPGHPASDLIPVDSRHDVDGGSLLLPLEHRHLIFDVGPLGELVGAHLGGIIAVCEVVPEVARHHLRGVEIIGRVDDHLRTDLRPFDGLPAVIAALLLGGGGRRLAACGGRSALRRGGGAPPALGAAQPVRARARKRLNICFFHAFTSQLSALSRERGTARCPPPYRHRTGCR